ncbi:tigger transposable element-derived protein 4-like [Dermacentor silvarum]|uniref:tigger transposable element-derived protein 4-like n=1 Tax=Dermacentor silvarum TaxID=543639 RepID=UPI00189C35B8|nr:tigger transposable element-derived protein 4-like [Dermacentor silvarum]
MPYHVLSVKEKLEIIRTIENGAKKSAVAREKNLPLTTVCGIWNAREKLRGGSGSNLKRCRIRDSAFPEVEKALLLWLKKARSMNLPVSGPLLAEKALTFAAQLNCTGFACSNGWLSRFKARYSIVGKAVCGEAAAADKEGADEWQHNELQEALAAYDAADIFNFDESALFYCLLPDRTLAFKNEKCTGGKHAKNRVSVAFGVNMTGSEKLPLMVIGRYGKPRCFKGARLPSDVIYKHNKKAWMTAQLFEEYVRQLDRRFAAKKRNVLIVLDNASAHVDLDNLTAIKLLFLPPNTTALAQPLDQGIIRSVKQTYRKNLLRRMLLVMDSGKTYTIDLLGAVHLLAHSWREVQPATIQNCFARAQFKILEGDDDADGGDAEDCENLLVEVLERQGAADEEVNFGTFRDVDGDVTTSPDFSDSDIVAAVAPRPASSESEEDSDVEVDDGPSLSDAARAVAVMRAFAEKRGLMDKLAAGLADFEDAVVAARPPRRQVKITDFLLPASE